MRDRFGASESGCRLRFHTQTGGVTLTAQQPLTNVVRVTVQALAATLGGTQSLHTNGYDEALALPSAEAATLALRTQQILAHESGVTNTADPLGGSYYVERLTDELESRALALVEKVEAQGGAVRAIESGFMQDEIARSAWEHQRRVESGDAVIVGVNRYAEDAEAPQMATPDYRRLEAEQAARVQAVRERRDGTLVRESLGRLAEYAAAYGDDARGGVRVPLVPAIVEAVRARATVGEISDTLARVWGKYRPA
jgi:methylmalonyl-CoA mutase N-terminal domain/subunit